jgi:hypothetical protein
VAQSHLCWLSEAISLCFNSPLEAISSPMVRAIYKTQLSYFRPISSDTKGLLFIEDIVSVLLLYSLVYDF